MDNSRNEEESHDIMDFLSFEDGLPEEFLKKAEMELGETEHRRNQSLKMLRERISESACGNLRDVDSQFLLMFLKARKFDVSRAFKMLKNFRRNMSWINTLKNLSTLDKIKEIWKDNIAGIISHRDRVGRAILVTRYENWDPQKWNVDEAFAAGVTSIILGLLHPMTQVNGYVIIFDMENYNFSQLRALTPKIAYLTVNCVQDCLPGRCKEIHVVHENAYFRFAYALLRPFISEKFKRRIFIHGSDKKSLHKYVDPRILNSELGGCRGAFDNSFAMRYCEKVGDKLLSLLKIS